MFFFSRHIAPCGEFVVVSPASPYASPFMESGFSTSLRSSRLVPNLDVKKHMICICRVSVISSYLGVCWCVETRVCVSSVLYVCPGVTTIRIYAHQTVKLRIYLGAERGLSFLTLLICPLFFELSGPKHLALETKEMFVFFARNLAFGAV